ncbi:hypothetical protein FACS189474_3910 [Bacteroidia bacterium]|nr:hypothetical protein FACS189474_3910 [Bacteroidia bacterium]
MRRLFTILFTAITFVSLSFGQMVVKGDVVNVGNLRSDVPVHLKAGATGTNGRISNAGTLNLKGGITYESNDVSDGLLFNDYDKGQVNFSGSGWATPAEKVQLVKTFKSGPNYAVSFPFDVRVKDITDTSGAYKAGYERQVYIWTYDSERRANRGITKTWKEIGNSNAEYDNYVLKAGIGYNLQVDEDEVTETEVTLIFPAADTNGNLASIYPTGGQKKSDLTYHRYDNSNPDRHPTPDDITSNSFGWNLLGVSRTANFEIANDINIFELDIHEDIEDMGIMSIHTINQLGKWIPQDISSSSLLVSPYIAYFVQLGTYGEPEDIENHITGFLYNKKSGLTYQNTGLRSSQHPDKILELKLEDGDGYSDYTDALSIIQSDRYRNRYVGGEDALTMLISNSAQIPEFYALVENVPVSIDRIQTIDSDIPVGVNLKRDASYTIGISQLKGFEDTDIYLIDKATGTSHNLSDGDYTFQAAKGTTDDRFALHFGSITAIQTPNSQISVFVENNTAHVKNIKVGDTVSIYNVGGQLISQGVASSSEQSYRLAGTGIYIVKVSGSESFISKVINK